MSSYNQSTVKAPAIHIPKPPAEQIDWARRGVTHSGEDELDYSAAKPPKTDEERREALKLEQAVEELKRKDPAKPSEQMLEESFKRFEQNYAASAAQRWAGQERWLGAENERSRVVNILHCDTFIRRLQRAGINAALANPALDDWIRQMTAWKGHSNFEVIGNCGARLWLNNFSRVGRIGITCWMQPEPGTLADQRGVCRAKTIATLQYPYGPEWDVLRFNEYMVPTSKKYHGWRTALLTLITAGVLSEEQAHEAFPLSYTAASAWYREQLWQHRKDKLAGA